jgi:hypothetical protein
LVYLLVLLIPNSCTIIFQEFYFLPFSVHIQQCNLCSLIVSVMVGFLTIAYISLLINSLNCVINTFRPGGI